MKKYATLLIIILLLTTACESKKYSVAFVDSDNTVLKTVQVKKGDNLKNIETPEKNGYIFVNWQQNGVDYDVTKPITEDTTLTAVWTEKPDLTQNHTVTFNIDGTIKTQTVADGEKAKKPANNPIKEKHVFLGWYVGEIEYDFDTPVTKDIIITAKFKKNRINITYDLNGGTGSTISVEIDKDSIPERPKTPTKFGYNFVSWVLDGKPYNFDFPLTSDTTIKALWEATVYVKVTFNTDGGNDISPVMLSLGATISKLPTAEKEGYIFKYWTYNGQEFDINTKINEDTILVAYYEQVAPPSTNEDTENDS